MIAKPKIFIGSSSEGLEVAEVLFSYLTADFYPFIWKHGMFIAGRFNLEELERALKEHDFAILCATPDDVLVKRGTTSPSMRDNVLFEFGMFIGALGRKRTFLVVPSGRDLAIPSDLAGIVYVPYDTDRFLMGSSDKMAALQTTAMALRTAVHRTWSELRSAEEQASRVRMAHARAYAIKKIHSFIVDLRDVLIELPGDIVQSLGKPSEFDKVKRSAADKVDRLAAPLHDDAVSAGVKSEFSDLIIATKSVLLGLPYPLELFVDEEDIIKAAVKHIVGALDEYNAGGRPVEYAGKAIEDEVERRARSIAIKYEEWWTRSEKVLRRATSRLQDALVNAALEQGAKQLPAAAGDRT